MPIMACWTHQGCSSCALSWSAPRLVSTRQPCNHLQPLTKCTKILLLMCKQPTAERLRLSTTLASQRCRFTES